MSGRYLVQRPQGRTTPSVFKNQQGGQCGWNGVEQGDPNRKLWRFVVFWHGHLKRKRACQGSPSLLTTACSHQSSWKEKIQHKDICWCISDGYKIVNRKWAFEGQWRSFKLIFQLKVITLEEKRRYWKGTASFINELKNRFDFPGPWLIIIEQWTLGKRQDRKEEFDR